MINEHDDFEANSSVVLLTTFVFYIMLLCVLWTKSTAGDEAIPLWSGGWVRCGPMRSGAVNSQTDCQRCWEEQQGECNEIQPGTPRSAWKPQTTTGHRRPPQDAVENCRTPIQTPQDGRIMCRLVRPMTAGRHRTLFLCHLFNDKINIHI